ncbi:MAG: 4-(cytidine 5'-diphospho)-2-C-methyl-D-erythritol kinase [Candidatus Pelethousia sp.]|nr:4-(cytidine 5'-diphospho)-2-C-methyl-D-erythritol kinase [Candidatus Pelethousia sp.]
MNSNILTLLAPAKINLTLDVLGRLPDGYHALRSIMASINLYDEITIAPAREISVTWEGDVCGPLPENNTARRAAAAFFAQTGLASRIHITKRIPDRAGLGGGSADAAAVLRGLQRLYGNVNDAALFSMARSIGADVPFCLMGGCALAEGIGEQLTALRPPTLHLLLLKGTDGISTPDLFASLSLPLPHPDTEAAIHRLLGPVEALAPLLANALEGPVLSRLPQLRELKARLLAAGALCAFMTGSGACMAGLFSYEAQALSALPAFVDIPFRTVCRTGAFAV